jgi:hypothetical protein
MKKIVLLSLCLCSLLPAVSKVDSVSSSGSTYQTASLKCDGGSAIFGKDIVRRYRSTIHKSLRFRCPKCHKIFKNLNFFLKHADECSFEGTPVAEMSAKKVNDLGRLQMIGLLFWCQEGKKAIDAVENFLRGQVNGNEYANPEDFSLSESTESTSY